MKCRMCGYEFDENEIPNRGCSGCGKHGCHSVHCPNCGFGNSPELDQEFDFIIKLKDKIKNRKNFRENFRRIEKRKIRLFRNTFYRIYD